MGGPAWLFSVVHSLPRRIEGVDSRPPAGNGSASHSSSWATELTVKLETSERIHVSPVFTYPGHNTLQMNAHPQTSSEKQEIVVNIETQQLATVQRIRDHRKHSPRGVNTHHPTRPPPRLRHHCTREMAVGYTTPSLAAELWETVNYWGKEKQLKECSRGWWTTLQWKTAHARISGEHKLVLRDYKKIGHRVGRIGKGGVGLEELGKGWI